MRQCWRCKQPSDELQQRRTLKGVIRLCPICDVVFRQMGWFIGSIDDKNVDVALTSGYGNEGSGGKSMFTIGDAVWVRVDGIRIKGEVVCLTDSDGPCCVRVSDTKKIWYDSRDLSKDESVNYPTRSRMLWSMGQMLRLHRRMLKRKDLSDENRRMIAAQSSSIVTLLDGSKQIYGMAALPTEEDLRKMAKTISRLCAKEG